MRKSFLVGCIVVALGCGDAFLTGGGSTTTSTTTTSTGGHGHGGKEDGGHGHGGSTTTSSSGGGGSTSTGGAGGSGGVSDGGGGSTSTGGGGASSSGGGSGGSPDVYAIDWSTTAGHAANAYLGIDLAIDQPNGPDTGMGDNKPYMGCIADSTSAETVHCELGALESGTTLTVTMYQYWDQQGTSFAYYWCDQDGFPTSDCPGILKFSKNGDAPYATWQDDNVAATPPPPPCSYTVVNTFLQLICGIP